MSRSPYSLNSYTGGATQAYLSTGVNSLATTLTISGTTVGWNPLGSTGGYYLALDYGTIYEEKIFVPSGSLSWGSSTVTLTGVTRGIDNSTAQGHNINAPVAVVLTATDISEANYLVNQILGTGSNSLDLTLLDNLQYSFDGISTYYTPTYQGSKVNITNPFLLQVILNGVQQKITSGPETVWLSYAPIEGMWIDNNGNLAFSEVPLPGSTFDGKLINGPATTSNTTVYPFTAVDILLGA